MHIHHYNSYHPGCCDSFLSGLPPPTHTPMRIDSYSPLSTRLPGKSIPNSKSVSHHIIFLLKLPVVFHLKQIKQLPSPVYKGQYVPSILYLPIFYLPSSFFLKHTKLIPFAGPYTFPSDSSTFQLSPNHLLRDALPDTVTYMIFSYTITWFRFLKAHSRCLIVWTSQVKG